MKEILSKENESFEVKVEQKAYSSESQMKGNEFYSFEHYPADVGAKGYR